MSPANWKMAVGKIMGYFILLFLLLWCVYTIVVTDEVDSFIILGIIFSDVRQSLFLGFKGISDSFKIRVKIPSNL